MPKKNIPFLDLHKQYESIKEEIDTAIARVVKKQWFILGEELEQFEREFGEYLGAKYVVGVGSGTDGLILALWALGIGKGDEVITPANSFIATTLAITQLGATPVLVDCDPETYQIDISQVEKKITKKTKAILPVHLYGAPCEIEALKAIAEKNKIFLVEDAAQAHGATYNGKKIGTFGDLAVFSFYPGKNLGAYGDGGAIVTNNRDLYEKLKKLRNYGQTKKYIHESIGLNSRLDEIQAAVLRVKLHHLDFWNEKRKKIVEVYKSLLQNTQMQKIIQNGNSVYHLLVIEHEKRDQLQSYLIEQGIETLIHYPVPIHLQPCYKYLSYNQGDFPIAESLAVRIVSLPLYPELKREEIKHITEAIQAFPS